MLTSSGIPTSGIPTSGSFSASTPLSRRLGHHQYERKVSVVSTAGIYDWKVTNFYHQPILPGQHNAFPRRLPSAGSEKLRQMYLNTDTVSGRLVFNTAHQRSREKRFNLLQQTLQHQAQELEERNRQLVPVRPSTGFATSSPSQNSRQRQQVVPPIRSSRGLTIIKESRRLQRNFSSLEASVDNSNITPVTGTKLHAEMSVYLPRADLVDDASSSRAPSQSDRSESGGPENTSLTPSTPPTLPKSNRYNLRNSQTAGTPQKNRKQTDVSKPLYNKPRKTFVSVESERPVTANW